MSAPDLYQALLRTEGYAVLEPAGAGKLRLLGSPPAWMHTLFGAGVATGSVLPAAQRMPFLENFLVDAQEFWKAKSDGRAESGTWVEWDEAGREIALEAFALCLEGKSLLILWNSQSRYEAARAVFQTARDFRLHQERLQRETQLKEILLHCIVHDLSQPLTAMRGCLSLLSLESLPEHMKNIVEIANRQSHRQETMIREILSAFAGELAAQEAAGQVSGQAPDLVRCAQEVVSDFQPAFSSQGVGLEVDSQLDPAAGWRVAGDESRLRRVFSNLLENALRYSPAGTRVTIRVADEGGYLRACVDDQGLGLGEGVSETQVFKLMAKRKESTGKAGLGLYFCKITVERWGGSVGCETRPQGGTRFWFRLPRAGAAADEKRETRERESVPGADAGGQAAARPTAPVAARRPLRVLLAEDMEVNRELAVRLLARRGHAVVAVGDGRQALAAFEQQSFDIILLDLEMPGMGGEEAAQLIRSMERKGATRVPIVALTGDVTEEARERCRRAGMDGFLSKPFDMQKLYEVVEDLAVRPAAPPPPHRKEMSAGEDLSRAALLGRVGGDAKLLESLVRIFLADCPKRLAAVRRSVTRGDGASLAGTAHALKGAVGVFGARRAFDAARALEAMGRKGELSAAQESLRVLEREIAAVGKRLAAFLKGKGKQTAALKSRSRKKGEVKTRRRKE
jgi:signal transduction histidine kinase/CheY-like chemotaxis protein